MDTEDVEAQPENATEPQPSINADDRPANTAADHTSSNTDHQPQVLSGTSTCPFNKL